MTTANRCAPDAWVVGAQPLPADPTEHDWPGRPDAVGCSHIVCLSCKAEVASRPGFYLKLGDDDRALVSQRAAQLRATDDWASIDGVEAAPECRLYACRCFYFPEFTRSLTCDPENVDNSGQVTRNLPWTCAGHPPLELPVQLGARSFTDAAALSMEIAKIATDPTQAVVVRDLYYRTHHGSLDAIVTDALAEAARGPAPLDPALKALFEAQTDLAPLSSFVEELIRYQRKLTTAASGRREQLVDVLAQAVLQRPSGSSETGTLELLRDEALEGVVTSSQLETLEYADGAWLVAHVEDLVARNPDRAGGILARAGRAMLSTSPDPDGAMQTLSTIARKTGATAATLSAGAEAALGVRVLDSKRVLEVIRSGGAK